MKVCPCTHGLKAKRATVEVFVEKSDKQLFFECDPTMNVNDDTEVFCNNVVHLPPMKDTWIEWDHGKLLHHHVKDDGTLAEFDIDIDDRIL